MGSSIEQIFKLGNVRICLELKDPGDFGAPDKGGGVRVIIYINNKCEDITNYFNELYDELNPFWNDYFDLQKEYEELKQENEELKTQRHPLLPRDFEEEE